MTTTHKLCRKCGERKPFSAFSVTAKGKGDRHNLRSRCKACHAIATNAWHAKNKLRSLENHRRWLAANPEKVRAYSKKWMAENPKWHAAISRAWRKKNPARNTAKTARYRTAQLRATPTWLSAIQRAQIAEFYEISAARTVQTGVAHHVDHIEPLQGRTLCGLHVPWNLQVLTGAENASKKNKIVEVCDGLRI